jgi:hypothetical protein
MTASVFGLPPGRGLKFCQLGIKSDGGQLRVFVLGSPNSRHWFSALTGKLEASLATYNYF